MEPFISDRKKKTSKNAKTKRSKGERSWRGKEKEERSRAKPEKSSLRKVRRNRTSREVTSRERLSREMDKAEPTTAVLTPTTTRIPVTSSLSHVTTVFPLTSFAEIFDPTTYTFHIEKTSNPEPSTRTPIQKTAFIGMATQIMTLGIEGLMKEYIGEIYSYVPNGFARAVFDANTDLKKNRYKDVVCNDRTRVVLHDGRPGDYIHANYVRGTRPGYILTQGPLKDSLFDFWRMIIQEQVLAICMLCEFQENGRWKCEPYYPELNESMTFGTITVKCEEMSKPDRHTHLKVLNVTDGATGKNVRVSHFKIVTWPDKTVALSNLSILRTHRALRKFVGNVVIHCSAGVGRTGTFVAIEIGVQLLLNGKTFRLSDLVKALRHCRMTSVQVDTQYLMMAETFVECGVIFKYIEDPKLIEGFEAFKKQVAEYVEAHPPPVEQYKLKGGKGEQPSMERLSAERVQPLSRGSKENPPCSVNPISPRPGDKPVSRSREQL